MKCFSLLLLLLFTTGMEALIHLVCTTRPISWIASCKRVGPRSLTRVRKDRVGLERRQLLKLCSRTTLCVNRSVDYRCLSLSTRFRESAQFLEEQRWFFSFHFSFPFFPFSPLSVLFYTLHFLVLLFSLVLSFVLSFSSCPFSYLSPLLCLFSFNLFICLFFSLPCISPVSFLFSLQFPSQFPSFLFSSLHSFPLYSLHVTPFFSSSIFFLPCFV